MVQRRIPDATYRLQFNRAFTFWDARRIIGYLHNLGISDVYASPYFRARAESTHGYDIADHNQLNPAIGSEREYAIFVRELQARGMGQIVDFVPNHMGIGEPANRWWTDVLENGPASLYADYFDIDWHPLKPALQNKVLLPILGDQYGVVLEQGELSLAYTDGAFSVRYWDTALPVEPTSVTRILSDTVPGLVDSLGAEHDATLELQSIITGLRNLPPPVALPRVRRLERTREVGVLKRRLDTLMATVSQARAALDDTLVALNGDRSDAATFDPLDDLLRAQPYRLSYWRTAGQEINYRRFFDVNDLAGIRVEDAAVFEASHRLLLRLIADGAVTGVRIDHPDGLWDPAAYLRRLQRGACERLTTEQADVADVEASVDIDRARSLYVVVEKIITGRERLRDDWPVDGTTGYEFANAVNAIFVDRSHRRAFDDIYDGFTHERIDFRELAYQQKKLVLTTALASDLNSLANGLARITEQARRYRDFTLVGLTDALREVIACFPIYRTYVTDEGGVHRQDRAAIDAAVTRARRLTPAVDETIYEFIRSMLLLEGPEYGRGPDRADQVAWVMKFQQITGPVMAKGVEDTAFYIYNRLISLNEVGGEPDQFGGGVQAFHRHNAERLERWPHAMLSSSTHDTKRSEDVRARINVLSEIPQAWSEAVAGWRSSVRPHKVILQDGVAPDRNEEYLFYQTLVGAWPLERMAAAAYAEFRERIAAYMLKAVREAKVNTSWVNPNEEYDAAIGRFVHSAMGDDDQSALARATAPLRELTARFGAYTSLAQTLLKLTAPGVPDIYQGNDLWDFSLVDPDNRRPVDYASRSRWLRALTREIASAGDDLAPLCRRLLARWRDGRIKLYVTQRALTFRRAHAELFRGGSYLPLSAIGERAEHICAFVREHHGQRVLVVTPRVLVGITPSDAHPIGSETWGDTTLLIPGGRAGERYRDVFTGATFTTDAASESGAATVRLAQVLGELPVAMVEKT